MNLNIMPKLYITRKNLYLNKKLDHKNDDHNNQILSFKTLCFINEFFFYFYSNGTWAMQFFQCTL
jgi:hypothetical protein